SRSAGRARHIHFRNDGTSRGGYSRSDQDRSFDEPSAAAGGSEPGRAYRAGASGDPEQVELQRFLNYQRPGGSDEERAVAAKWLRPRVSDATPERLLVYPGNQAVLFNALMSLTSPGDLVLTEALTFPGVKAAAEQLGLRLVGVAMDEEGIRPDALKAACK